VVEHERLEAEPVMDGELVLIVPRTTAGRHRRA
jgi:hypothetical protein